MKIVGLTVVRNEAWIIGLTLRTALRWVDEEVVLLHACSDGTREIVDKVAAENPGRVTILEEKDPVWMEMDHRQRTLDRGRERGGTHFAIIDADELPTSNIIGQLRGWCGRLRPAQLLDLPMIPVWDGLEMYRCDPGGIWSGTWITLAFRDFEALFWKAKDDGYQYHSRPPYRSLCEVPDRLRFLDRETEGGIMHLQFASKRRFLAKHAHYKMEEVVRWPGREPNIVIDRKYSVVTKEDGAKLKECRPEWWEGYDKQLVDLEHVPWHEAECKKMWKQYGPGKFKWMNLFGLVP